MTEYKIESQERLEEYLYSLMNKILQAETLEEAKLLASSLRDYLSTYRD